MHPSQGQLAGGDPLLGGQALDLLDQLQVAGEVLTLEARLVAAEVVLVEVVGAGDLSGQESPPQRAVGDDADAELAGHGYDVGLEIAGPQRPLALQGADGVGGVGPADRLGTGF